MRETRIIVGIVFTLLGISVLISLQRTDDPGRVSSAITIFCTGLILVFCGPDKNSKP